MRDDNAASESSACAVVVGSGLFWDSVSVNTFELFPAGTSAISGCLSLGRAKRRSWGLKNRNRTTLTAPERLKIMIPKNVAADGT